MKSKSFRFDSCSEKMNVVSIIVEKAVEPIHRAPAPMKSPVGDQHNDKTDVASQGKE